MTVILAPKDTVKESRTSQETDVTRVQGCERPTGCRHRLSEEDAAGLPIS